MNTTQTAANVIGQCSEGHRFVATAGTVTGLTACPTCVDVVTLIPGPPDSELEPLRVVKHPAVKWGKPVQARVTASECDGACRSAKSSRCSCSCGGENHGAALDRIY